MVAVAIVVDNYCEERDAESEVFEEYAVDLGGTIVSRCAAGTGGEGGRPLTLFPSLEWSCFTPGSFCMEVIMASNWSRTTKPLVLILGAQETKVATQLMACGKIGMRGRDGTA